MVWNVSAECIQVLTQLGYNRADIELAKYEYEQLAAVEQSLVKATDRAFVDYFRAKNSHLITNVERKLRSTGTYQISERFRQRLFKQGYWEEVIDFALDEYRSASEYTASEIIVSRDAHFLQFIGRQLPLEQIDLAVWMPSSMLKRCLNFHHAKKFDLSKIVSQFQSAGHENCFFPRFYFYFLTAKSIHTP
jgi:hypothetical protein